MLPSMRDRVSFHLGIPTLSMPSDGVLGKPHLVHLQLHDIADVLFLESFSKNQDSLTARLRLTACLRQ